jgi:hypothetical protein
MQLQAASYGLQVKYAMYYLRPVACSLWLYLFGTCSMFLLFLCEFGIANRPQLLLQAPGSAFTVKLYG